VQLIIDYPERVYGRWWYINDDNSRGPIEGWYIWIQSLKLLSITRHTQSWRITADDLEAALQAWPIMAPAPPKQVAAWRPKVKQKVAAQVTCSNEVNKASMPASTIAFTMIHGEKRWRATIQ